MKKRIEEVVAVELANGFNVIETGLTASVIVYVLCSVAEVLFSWRA